MGLSIFFVKFILFCSFFSYFTKNRKKLTLVITNIKKSRYIFALKNLYKEWGGEILSKYDKKKIKKIKQEKEEKYCQRLIDRQIDM